MMIRLLALTVKLKQKLISSEQKRAQDTQLKENKRNEN